jgi:acetyl esterase
METDAQVTALLQELIASGRPSSMSLPLLEGRRNFTELFASLAERPDIAQVREVAIPGAGGDLPTRLYAPSSAGPLPVLMYFHGGGWVFGGAEAFDGLARSLARASGALVVAPEFRLAPEHPFPASLEDCFIAATWVEAHAEELGGDGTRLAAAGESSGANLAAAVTLRAKEAGRPRLEFQLLMYPAVDPSLSTASYEENAEDPFLSKAEMTWYWDRYLGPHGDRANPHAAPLNAPDLRGLPPAYIVTAGHDVLRDEGEAYAQRLRDAGVPVTVARYPDMVHGFLSMTRHLDTAGIALKEAGKAVADAFGARVGSER